MKCSWVTWKLLSLALVQFWCLARIRTEATSIDQHSFNSTSSYGARPLGNKQAPPYAVVDRQESEHTRKNVLLTLTLNQTSQSASDPSGETGHQWTLIGQNGTLLDESASVNLKRLLDTLNSNNLTSEVRFDEQRPGIVNITISNLHPDRLHEEARELMLLEDLLDESRYEPALNLTSVFRDNHRLVTRQPARSKPSSTVAPGLLMATSMTVPPIRRVQDVVAENYTTKKIANEANIFALKLLEQLNIERLGNENIIHSPFATYQGLALLLAGAAGDTSRELDKLLLSVESVYENTKLTHDQDRARLTASFGDVVRQLQLSATSHFSGGSDACDTDNPSECRQLTRALDRLLYRGGSQEQHFIVANNLLLSPAAYEISNEFKSLLNDYFNNTAITKMEIGSTESVQVVNSWIRQATAGIIPAIIGKKITFDEFNVMTLMSTSWLSQEWHNSFRRIASPLKTNVRLKGQTIIRGAKKTVLDEPLMEFVDDQKSSHFVEYIQSEPTRAIHNYHVYLNQQLVDVVVIKFRNSNQRMIALTPLVAPSTSGNSISASIANQLIMMNQSIDLNLDSEPTTPTQQAPAESSLLSKMITNFATEPRRVLRQLWNTISPEIITKQTLQSMHLPPNRQENLSTQVVDMLPSAPVPPKVRLSMPLMRLEADATISAALNHVGLVNAFDPAQANFIGINGHPFNYNKLHLSNVIYKTTFNLNEAGINYDRTVRTLESMRTSTQKKFQQQQLEKLEPDLKKGELINEVHLNKPFMFMICDIKSRLILYTGVVRNPAN